MSAMAHWTKALIPAGAAIGLGAAAAPARAQSDTCASATLITEGAYSGSTSGATNDGAASCGTSETTPDLWYRFDAAQACQLRINTCGSSYDTVLSVHTACPGSAANELACNDDTGGGCEPGGLGSTVAVAATAGTSYYIRVSGFDGRTGPYALAGTSASIVLFKPGAPGAMSGATIGPETCPADWNLDGVVNSQDYFDFLASFFAAPPNADFNGDGVTNSQDFFDFVAAFFSVC